jgi:hypothetical protein
MTKGQKTLRHPRFERQPHEVQKGTRMNYSLKNYWKVMFFRFTACAGLLGGVRGELDHPHGWLSFFFGLMAAYAWTLADKEAASAARAPDESG